MKDFIVCEMFEDTALYYRMVKVQAKHASEANDKVRDMDDRETYDLMEYIEPSAGPSCFRSVPVGKDEAEHEAQNLCMEYLNRKRDNLTKIVDCMRRMVASTVDDKTSVHHVGKLLHEGMLLVAEFDELNKDD